MRLKTGVKERAGPMRVHEVGADAEEGQELLSHPVLKPFLYV